MTTKLFILCVALSFTAAAQDKPAYLLYNKEGNEARYEKMIRELEKSDVILVGELHDNPISHWLELQILKSIYEKDNKVTLGMEMFEADDQIVLNEYLGGVIEEKHLLKEAKIWDNYPTDYKPLVEFAKSKKLKVIATNVPRRYANLVYRRGILSLDSLPAEAKKWIAPQPIPVDLELPGYKDMIASMGAHAKGGSVSNMATSQAVKDATMAHFIVTNPDSKFIHFNGTYHSKNGEGIIWYLKKYNPSLRVSAIHVVEQDVITSLKDENKNSAEYIIVIPKDMTKSY